MQGLGVLALGLRALGLVAFLCEGGAYVELKRRTHDRRVFRKMIFLGPASSAWVFEV